MSLPFYDLRGLMSGFLPFVFFALYAGNPIFASAHPDERLPPSDALGRPWEMRYVLALRSDRSWDLISKSASKLNETRRAKGLPLLWEHLAKPHARLQWRNPPDEDRGALLLLLRFSENGKIEPGPSWEFDGRGYISHLLYFMLERWEKGAQPESYWIGYWFTGIGDASTHWAPAICHDHDTRDPLSHKNPGYLYGPAYSAHEYRGTFGCREWAYQLYDPGRPYIDVTSYIPGHIKSDYRTYIRDFIGWARFGDRKPVIGRHGEDWYCLFDCPNDEPPGHIPNIKLWAAKNGWPAPKPPTRSPTFPDPPLKQGTYP